VRTLSEGGLSVETALRIENGDSIRLRILPHRGDRAVTVEGIVWNEQPAARGGNGTRMRRLGCVVSDPPAEFLALLAEVEKRSPAAASRPPPDRKRSGPEPPECEADLPRSRAPLPPPKPDPEELLPRFRVRLKQVGGPRTRIVAVRARSVAQAAERARSGLAARTGERAEDWEVLESLREEAQTPGS
jgi:hypothetical protein